MKNITKSVLIAGLLFSSGSLCAQGSFSVGSVSQKTINVAGNSATINGMTFTYSLGEMALITTEKNTDLIITQGLLQPGKNAKNGQATTSVTGTPANDVVKVYPNPTKTILFVESFEIAAREISYQLFDAGGKLVLSNILNQKAGFNKFSLDLQSFAAGAYYLMIRKPNAAGIFENFSYKIHKAN